jgi:hypothetical protein
MQMAGGFAHEMRNVRSPRPLMVRQSKRLSERAHLRPSQRHAHIKPGRTLSCSITRTRVQRCNWPSPTQARL